MVEIEDSFEVSDPHSVEAKTLLSDVTRKLKAYCLERGLRRPRVRVSWKIIGTPRNPRYRAAVFARLDRV